MVDSQGNTPLPTAKARGFGEMVKMLEQAGAK